MADSDLEIRLSRFNIPSTKKSISSIQFPYNFMMNPQKGFLVVPYHQGLFIPMKEINYSRESGVYYKFNEKVRIEPFSYHIYEWK